MYTTVNPANMARAIQSFVQAAGGTTSYSAALELVSHMCGFDNYRAQKAYAEVNAAPDHVVFETTLQAWDKGVDGQSPTQAQRREDVYRLQVEQHGRQLRLAVVPADVQDPLMSSGRNVLDLLLEINQGLPCAHLTNDSAGDRLLTVFGHAGGLLVRENEAQLEPLSAANAKLAAHVEDERWVYPGSRDDAYVMNRDTEALWDDHAD